MPDEFDRRDTADPGLPEPYAALLAFLSDLHEQAEIHRAAVGDDFGRLILDELLKQVAALGLMVRIRGGAGSE